jgi:hypothetical protein
MVRRLRRRRFSRPVRTARYSSETTHIYDLLTIIQGQAPTVPALLVPGSNAQGVRKAKNLTVKFVTTTLHVPLIFAVVYVPEGVNPGTLTLSVGTPSAPLSLYEPAQNVIMYGQLVTQPQSPQQFHTRLARNLQSNDSIYLLLRPLVKYDEGQWVVNLDILCNYAICYYTLHYY